MASGDEDLSSQYHMVLPYGNNIEPIKVAIDNLPLAGATALLPRNPKLFVADEVRLLFSQKGILFEEMRLDTNFVNGFFNAMYELKKRKKNNILVVNVSAGTSPYSYYLLCAAMGAGVMAFATQESEIVFLPVSCSITHGA